MEDWEPGLGQLLLVKVYVIPKNQHQLDGMEAIKQNQVIYYPVLLLITFRAGSQSRNM